jgi:hypothetical protein
LHSREVPRSFYSVYCLRPVQFPRSLSFALWFIVFVLGRRWGPYRECWIPRH